MGAGAIVATVLLAGCTVETIPGPIEPDETCVPGATSCEGTTLLTCMEDGMRMHETSCEGSCDPTEGCVACIPGDFRCVGGISERCQPERTWVRLRDCREWGSACGDEGLCDDECAAAERSGTFAGCDFQLVALPADNQSLSAVVANLGASPNEVEILRDGVRVASASLAPRAVVVLPVERMTIQAGSQIGRDFTARLRSSAPVLVTQFQPFTPLVASADASLLIPRHALGREHVVASYAALAVVLREVDPEPPHEPWEATDRHSRLGTMTIVAPPDEVANVEVTPTAPLQRDPSGRVPEVAAGATLRLTLAPGEAVQLTTARPPECTRARDWSEIFWCGGTDERMRCFDGGACHEPAYDLSGTRVRSDRPVAVFGAHECANVPFDRPYCDRLEEQMPPVETWGLEHVSMAVGSVDVVRIVAARDGTRVWIEPPQGGVDGGTLAAGEWLEVLATEAFRVTSDRPILVAQYLRGEGARNHEDRDRGDPSLWIVPPTEQFRSEYAISLPHAYLEREEGAQFLLVARPVGTWTAIGGVRVEGELTRVGSWEVGLVRVGGGVQQIVGEAAFSLVAIGMSRATSYATAVGRDLRPLLY